MLTVWFCIAGKRSAAVAEYAERYDKK